MTFQRSPGALHSVHLFYRVDIVAYCEGGPATSIQDAVSTTTQESTLDTVYWSRVIEFIKIGKRVYCKSIGSRTTALAIAHMREAEGCTNISICMDADYDEPLAVRYNSTRVCYTHGYSWESDVLHEAVLPNILRHFMGVPPSEVVSELQRNVERYKSTMSKWCEVDIALRKKNKSCVLDRDKPQSNITQTGWPEINVDRLRANLRQCGYKRRPRVVHRVTTDSVMRITYGKAISAYMYRLIVTLAKRVSAKIRIDYDNFMRVAITETFSLIERGGLEGLANHIISRKSAFL